MAPRPVVTPVATPLPSVIVIVVIAPAAVVAVPPAAVPSQFGVDAFDMAARHDRRCRRGCRSDDARQHGSCERDSDWLHFILRIFYCARRALRR
jgi:hypothetical protein